MKFYLSSTCSEFKSLSKIIDELTAFGVRNIELSGNIQHEEHLLEKTLQFKGKGRLQFLIHHYFPTPREDFVANLATLDPAIREKTFSLIRNAIEFVKACDRPFYAVHGGHNVDMRPQMVNYHFVVDGEALRSKKDAQKAFFDNLTSVMEKIAGGDVRLAIENLTPR